MSDDEGYITDVIAHQVATKGTELSITVLVDGTPVTGMLTHHLIFGDWVKQVLALAAIDSDAFIADVEQPSRARLQECADTWKATLRKRGQDPEERAMYPWVHIRNARIENGPPETWQPRGILQVDASKIGA